MKKILSIFLGISFISMAMTGNASLLTSDTIVGSTVVDFSTQPTVEDVNGPLQIGMLVGENIEVSSPTGQLYTNYDGWGLGPNGNWESPMTYVSQNENGGTMIFAFMDGPVSARIHRKSDRHKPFGQKFPFLNNSWPSPNRPFYKIGRLAGNALLKKSLMIHCVRRLVGIL